MTIQFPEFAGVRCIMMPYIQGESSSVPSEYHAYADIIRSVFYRRGDIGFLTIDESVAEAGKPHRGARAKFGRPLHTEAGRVPPGLYAWGGSSRWAGRPDVWLEDHVRVLLASSVDDTCAIWPTEHPDTSLDGDIGDCAEQYPYEAARILKAGEVADIGILTPHESLPVKATMKRQFLRIVSSGVHGREPYFTENPLVRL